MLHLLSKLPKEELGWQQINTMVLPNDTVVIYQESLNELHFYENKQNVRLLIERGVKVSICADINFDSSKVLDGTTTVSWSDIVDMVEHAEGVNSL